MDWLTAKKAEAASSTMDFCKRLTIPHLFVGGLFWWTAGMRANQEITERKRRSREEDQAAGE
jgi:hypothetical protein